MDEVRFVLDSFQNNFINKRKMPLVIYGLGKNTREIINAFPDMEIVGLMDEMRTGETVFGKRVLGFEEVKKLEVKNILILARAANLQIIYRRIKDFTKENHISVFDINGSLIENARSDVYELPRYYKDITIEKLWDEIEAVDVVSFDIFDTLLVRDVLYPTDIFDSLRCDGVSAKEIRQCRIWAERELYLETNPTIYEIYRRCKEAYGFSDEQCRELLTQEIKLESEHLFPRKAMVELLQKIQKEKPVFLTSDMYLPRDVLFPILQRNGINVEKSKILISCEERVGKCNGLYRRLQKLNEGKRILHIGDNYDADILAAQNAGIDKTFYIRNVYGMLEDSRLRELADYQSGSYQRSMTAGFINYHFDNPFLFSDTGGKAVLSTEYQLGYYYIAPVIICFVKWMQEVLEREHIDNVLLGSRDGFLLMEIFDLLKNLGIRMPEYQYLYSSRSVCLLAGIRDEKDILYVASLAFQGNVKELLAQRFRLDKDQIQKRRGASDEDYVLLHKEVIFQNAADMRARYLKYLDSVIDAAKDYALFDFVSSGSCQMGLEKILNRSFTGIYFYRLYDKFKEHLRIWSMYKERYVYEEQEALVNNYFFLENVMTSFEPTLYDFSKEGAPIFMEETRSRLQLSELKEIHDGILAAVRKVAENGWDHVDCEVAFADLGIKLLNGKYIKLATTYFRDNVLKDEFCNREFDISADVM